MKRVYVLLLAGMALVCSAPARADEPPDISPEKMSKYMRLKLVHSQKLVEALALEDYEQLARYSHELKLLSQESIWNVLQTEQYALHSEDFRRRCDALTAAAKRKNLDGASLAFVELTLNCVQCHKYVRDTRKDHADLRLKPNPK